MAGSFTVAYKFMSEKARERERLHAQHAFIRVHFTRVLLLARRLIYHDARIPRKKNYSRFLAADVIIPYGNGVLLAWRSGVRGKIGEKRKKIVPTRRSSPRIYIPSGIPRDFMTAHYGVSQTYGDEPAFILLSFISLSNFPNVSGRTVCSA